MKNTSLEAKEKSKGFKSKHHKRILSVLALTDNPLTYKQIATLGSFKNPVSVARRMSELVKADRVEIDGQVICPIAKTRCSSYVISY